jgi:outer membrane protein
MRALFWVWAGWLVMGSQPAAAVDLMAVYGSAKTNDAGFAAAQAGAATGAEKVHQGRAGLLPVVSADVNTQWNALEYQERNSSGASATQSRYNSHGWQLTLTQPLLRPQNWVAYRQGEIQEILTRAQFEGVRMDLIVRVAQTYFNVHIASAALDSALKQEEAIIQQRLFAQRHFELGMATITDTHEAQARLDLAVAQTLAARNERDIQEEALRTLTAHPYEAHQLRPLRTDISLPTPLPLDIAQWAQRAQEGSSAVAVALARAELARLESVHARAGHWPTVDLIAQKGSTGQTGAFASGQSLTGYRLDSSSVGVQLHIPLWTGGATASRSREMALLHEKAQFEAEDARRQAALLCRQAYRGVLSAHAQVRALDAAQQSSLLALAALQTGYDLGLRVNIDVLNAQSQLHDIRIKRLKARVEVIMGLLRLKAVAGVLTEQDLAQVNALLESAPTGALTQETAPCQQDGNPESAPGNQDQCRAVDAQVSGQGTR